MNESAALPDDSAKASSKPGLLQRMLNGIESVGNKVPHPAIIFLGLIGIVLLLSVLLSALDVKVTYDVIEPPPVVSEQTYNGGSVVPHDEPSLPDYTTTDVEVHQETTSIRSMLGADGIRFIFSSFVNNFANFSVVAVIFIAMIGVGVAEEAGLMAALIRKLVAVSPPKALTFIIVLVGGLSSIATDAGYLILIPLGAAAFLSVGRHPLAGLAAAYAGVSASFAVNVLITPLDGLLTEVTNEAIAIVDPNVTIDLTANLWFSIVSTIVMALVMTIVVEKVTERTLGPYQGEDVVHVDEDVPEGEPRGLRYATLGAAAVLLLVVLLTAFPDAPLRNPETGAIFNDSPLMDSLIFIITLVFLAAGIGFGIGAKTMSGSVDVINAIVKTFAGLSGLIFLLLLIAQFIAIFNFSNMPTVIAVKMADWLEGADIGPLWLLIGFIVVIMILDLIIPGALPKWAIFAPIFVPLFFRLGIPPQTVLAAYRIGDSPMNVITPLMVYLPFIVIVAQRYKKDAGIGTIISLMLPFTAIVMVSWIAMFVIWYLVGIPVGPGYPVTL